MQYICQLCKEKFETYDWDKKRKYCSRKCLNDSKKGKPSWNKGKPRTWDSPSEFKKGETAREKNIKWKGGRYLTTQGYMVILKPGHHLANCRGYVKEEILVAEVMLGRPLLKGEIVHHINEIRNDNRPENLKVFPNHSEHQKHHLNLRYKTNKC